MAHSPNEGSIYTLDMPPLTVAELIRLRRLTNLSDAELNALANVGIGVVTAGRIRKFLLYVLATLGAIASSCVVFMQVWSTWKNH
jgi:hypothetical protein